jgi:hypothetical protein
MNYIIVQPEADMTSADRAVAITEELFRVSRPDSVRSAADVSRYIFGWVDHPTSGERALTVDVDYTINVHPDNNLDTLLSLFPEVPEAERTQLSQAIASANSFRFGDIIPSTATVRDQQYMEDNGWFPAEEV